jgi:hypothetical protein
MTSERRFTAAPLSSPWSAKEEERERGEEIFLSRVDMAEFKFEFEFV